MLPARSIDLQLFYVQLYIKRKRQCDEYEPSMEESRLCVSLTVIRSSYTLIC